MHKNKKFELVSNSGKKPFFSINKLKMIILILIIFSVIVLSLFVLTNNLLEELRQDHILFVNNSVEKISFLNNEIFKLTNSNIDLNKSLLNLTNQYNLLSSKTNALEFSYSNLKVEVAETLSKIDSYEREIQSSLEWFNSNSILDKANENVLLNLNSNCKKTTSKVCQINLGCFHLVNSEFINYKYKDDLITSNISDKLQSISEFIKNKGGDCEDFSLFFKAEYNSLVNSCDGKKPSLFAWIEKTSSRFWANFNETWYLQNATIKYLGEDNIFPIVVCGAIFNPQTSEVNGHCVLAFASKKIISAKDISILNSAELVEPQTGNYLGFIGADSGVFLVSEKTSSLSYINTLITDNDFFIYKNNEWSNYGKFGEELLVDKNSLLDLLNN